MCYDRGPGLCCVTRGNICDFVKLRTHRCYDRGRGTCRVTCGNISDIVKLRTHMCYDRGRGTCCVTCGNIFPWWRPSGDTHLLGFVTDIAILGTHMYYDRGRDTYGVSHGNIWYRPTEDTHVLRQRTWCVLCYLREHLSVITPIWRHTRVRSCDWCRPSGDTHVLRKRSMLCYCMRYNFGKWSICSFCSRSSDIFIVITRDGVTFVLQARTLRKCDRVIGLYLTKAGFVFSCCWHTACETYPNVTYIWFWIGITMLCRWQLQNSECLYSLFVLLIVYTKSYSAWCSIT